MSKEPSDKTLLIVEDDPGLQSQLRWHFDAYNVIIAGDREAAVAAVRQHEPAVILQDLGLPPDEEGVEEGFKTVQEISSISPSTKIIVVTGNHDYENAVRAVAMGPMTFIKNRSTQKPWISSYNARTTCIRWNSKTVNCMKNSNHHLMVSLPLTHKCYGFAEL